MKRPNISIMRTFSGGLAILALAGLPILSGSSAAEEKAGEGLAFLPQNLVDAEGKNVRREKALQGKTVGLYFSAKWCAPCKAFTPGLVKFRDANSKEFEIVFVSFDKDDKELKDYMKSYGMKFPAVNFEGEARQELADRYGVRSIPTLVIIGADGKEITRDGRGDLTADAGGALAKWKKG
ncbi:MAG TPA: thioredoxin family protein [Verrucomicrobiales bacterium]|nr:thioredoxin family protein [Verrucomicrobiales bacterium]